MICVQLWGNFNILWHCPSLGLEWKLTFSSPVATAEFSKFVGMFGFVFLVFLLKISVTVFISHANKVMLKILQARLQQYVNWELPDVQDGFRKGRGTRDKIANICWIIEKAREFEKNIYFCFIDYAKAFDCVDHNKLWKILQEMKTTGPPDLPL